MQLQGHDLFSLVMAVLNCKFYITIVLNLYFYVDVFLFFYLFIFSLWVIAAMCEKLYIFEGDVGAGRFAFFLAAQILSSPARF